MFSAASGNACCGRDCNYALGVARARKLLGPWEKSPGNPILAANDNWKCPGHGTIVGDARGRFYLLYHAYHRNGSVYVGRQALLDEVTWGADGWPTINGGRGPSKQASSPFKTNARGLQYSFFDSFSSRQLGPGWIWPLAKEPAIRLASGNGGWLVLSGQPDPTSSEVSAMLARASLSDNYVATTLLDISNLKSGAFAGLAAIGDQQNVLTLTVSDGHLVLSVRENDNSHRIVTSLPVPGSASLQLRMTGRWCS